REMGAFVVLVVENEFWIGLLSPTLWRLVDLFGESAHGDRDLNASHIEEAAAGRKSMPGVPVETRRRDRSIRQPIERDVVEHIVAAQPFRFAIENSRDHLVTANVVIEYPARQTNWRIDDSVQSLRAVV